MVADQLVKILQTIVVVDNLDTNIKKGLIFGTIGVFLIGLQPVISNSRPSIIVPYIFAAITALIEALISFHSIILKGKG